MTIDRILCITLASMLALGVAASVPAGALPEEDPFSCSGEVTNGQETCSFVCIPGRQITVSFTGSGTVYGDCMIESSEPPIIQGASAECTSYGTSCSATSDAAAIVPTGRCLGIAHAGGGGSFTCGVAKLPI